jgi:hypothetical protein
VIGAAIMVGRIATSMDSGEHCRAQLAECHGLAPSAKSQVEATILKSIARTWVVIANRSDR